jgi:hypothetical protein
MIAFIVTTTLGQLGRRALTGAALGVLLAVTPAAPGPAAALEHDPYADTLILGRTMIRPT